MKVRKTKEVHRVNNKVPTNKHAKPSEPKRFNLDLGNRQPDRMFNPCFAQQLGYTKSITYRSF